MKIRNALLILSFSICTFSQNITNTLGTSGQFSIKDGTTTYLSLGLSNGYLSLNRSLTLLNTTGSSTGVIYKGNDRFIHNYQSPSSFGENTFLGINSGNFSMNGSGNESSYNTGIGMYSLYTIATGFENTALGHGSLSYTNIGYKNTAIGTSAMVMNSSGHDNSSVGCQSLYLNSFGSYNTSIGTSSLRNNNTGFYNTAVGNQSLLSNQNGSGNTALGNNTLLLNAVGEFNTAVGNYALGELTSGSFNTAVGTSSSSNLSSGNNNITIGYDCQVPSSTGSNQVRIGNGTITYAGIQVAWSITSDRKWKENIVTSPLGLNFINKLHPVSYTRINDESKKTEYGLIAQEVEEALNEEEAENTAMITVTDEGNYELRYNDLIAPMIKAIQEIKAENEELKEEIRTLKENEERIIRLESIITAIEKEKVLKIAGE